MKLLIPGLRRIGLGLISVPVMSLSMTGCHRKQAPQPTFADFVLNYDSAPDPLLQERLEAIDGRIRSIARPSGCTGYAFVFSRTPRTSGFVALGLTL